jgi:DNA polymerase-3 subunit gamma/tau
MAKRKPEAPAAPVPPPTAPAGYTVLARRYRPRQFAELVGQEAVAQALANAIGSNRVAHAYLFTGARGVGKTSAARILAKALNCEHGPTATPCDQCDICRSIAAGEDTDVLEIDGASNRRIDEIREIRSNVQYRPGRARYRIYIIDEVHMLTKEAFNALLKTLEEPPPHVKFIFATTEADKVPITILSRCQRFDFAGIGTARITERLRAIVAGEGLQADDEALELVARRAGGSMRDAQSLLDQLLAFGGERLTAEQVHRLLGSARDDRVADLAAAVVDHDARKALELLAGMADEGLQLGELIDQLMAYWRDLMVVSCAGEQAQVLSVPGSHRETLARQAGALKLDSILAGLDVLVTAKNRLRTSSHDRVLLEMALIRLSRLDDLVSLGQLAQWLRQAPAGGDTRPAGRVTTPPGQPAARPTPAGPRLSELAAESAKKKASGAEELTAPAHIPLTAETVQQVWQHALSQVGPMLATDLGRAGDVAISGPNTLVIRFHPRYNFLREQCQDPERVARVEEVLARITGQDCKLRVEVGGGDAADVPAGNGGPVSPAPRRRSAALDSPLIQRAVEVLGAQEVRSDPEFGDEAPAESVPGEEA